MHRFTGPSAASPALRSSLLGLMLGRSMYHRVLKGAVTRICPHQIRLWAHQVETKVPGPPRPPRRSRPSRPARWPPGAHRATSPMWCHGSPASTHAGSPGRSSWRPAAWGNCPARSSSGPVNRTGSPGRRRGAAKNEYQPSEPAGQQAGPQIGARLVTSRTAANCCLSWCVADREAAYVSAAACRSCVCADK